MITGDRIMIGYERGIQRLGHSPARLGRGFPTWSYEGRYNVGSGTFCKSVSFKQSSLINDHIGFYLRFMPRRYIHMQKRQTHRMTN